jgi:hypothetical protein
MRPLQVEIWLLLGLALFIMPSCAFWQKRAEKQVFEFSSGGAYHFEGYGEWQIKVDTEGNFSVTHNVQGEVKTYGTFALTEKETADLWQLIRTIHIEEMSPPQRAGVPDEVQYTFNLEDETDVYTVKIWLNDAGQNDQIMALVNQMATLIKKYIGETPILN